MIQIISACLKIKHVYLWWGVFKQGCIFFCLPKVWAFVLFGGKKLRKKEKGGRKEEEGKREGREKQIRGKRSFACSQKILRGPLNWPFEGTKTLHYTTKIQKNFLHEGICPPNNITHFFFEVCADYGYLYYTPVF